MLHAGRGGEGGAGACMRGDALCTEILKPQPAAQPERGAPLVKHGGALVEERRLAPLRHPSDVGAHSDVDLAAGSR